MQLNPLKPSLFRDLLLCAAASLIFIPNASSQTVPGQKGSDTQTQKIKQDTNKTVARPTDVTRSFDWGGGKTKVRERLPNPYAFSGRRDSIVDSVMDALKERKLVIDETASRPKDGMVITQPFVFAKGAVITPSELNRYAVIQSSDTAWTRGQYTLIIEVQPTDATHNSVSVNAKVEGRSGNGLTSEWTTLQSSGVAEDDFLAKLVELITGATPEPVVNNGDQKPLDK
jgi:hypothetical protein